MVLWGSVGGGDCGVGPSLSSLVPSAQWTEVHDESGEAVRASLQELLRPCFPAPWVSPSPLGLGSALDCLLPTGLAAWAGELGAR